ncbi:MAG: hypothetical protein IT449_05230 [Phycisphaerales bacterium]|nr:hypothetical protein [Phycisphaerales bacterium]
MKLATIVRRINLACRIGISLGISGGTALSFGGCEAHADEFREAAAPALRTGVDSLMDGLVEGVFAVVEPEASSTDDSASTGGA